MYPRLTKEEFKYLKKKKKEFFTKFNLVKVPLYRQIAVSIQNLAVRKAMKGRREEAIDHHFKACAYYPGIGIDRPEFKKKVGLPTFNK